MKCVLPLVLAHFSENIQANVKLIERIELVQGDITRLQVDAIVNAANRSLLGGGGVDGAIHRAAGPELLNACRSLGDCDTGEARITCGYKLPARYVIHTVGPIYQGSKKNAHLLAACYNHSLELAVEYKLENIAFPAISCGIYGYPIVAACAVALETTGAFLAEHPRPSRVILALFSAADYQVYAEQLEQLKGPFC